MDGKFKDSEFMSTEEKGRVIKNWERFIESGFERKYFTKRLYNHLIQHCSFIAHYDINGFKATYCHPKDFAGVFIRHFDREHRYFNGIYPCHEEPYRDTGYTKAEIKREFCRIVEIHKDSTAAWARQKQKDERYAVYLNLKKEFEPQGLSLSCEACGNEYEVRVLKENEEFTDSGIICCLFCGQQIKLY